MGSKKYPANLPYTSSPITVEQNGSEGRKKKKLKAEKEADLIKITRGVLGKSTVDRY